MLTILGTLLALAFGLLMGGAEAGEEIMAMRGPARTVRAEVSLIPDRQPAEIRFRSESDYIVWKSAVLRKPLMVAGGALELEPSAGYAAAQPYVRLPEPREGMLAYLGRELLLR